MEPNITLTLTGIAHSGDALGRLEDGRAVFVPYGLPGEEVNVRIVEFAERFARAELLEIITPVEERITPRCKHFTVCGGCNFQHIPYEMQLEIKHTMVVDQFQRLEAVDPAIIDPVVPSPDEWGYRNHIQFQVNEKGELGFFGTRSHDVVPITECHIAAPIIQEIWPMMDLGPVPGLEQVTFRSGAGDDVLVTLESEDPDPPEFHADLPVSVVHHGPEGIKLLAGDDHVVHEVAGRYFRSTAGAFFQINLPVVEKMLAHILEAVPEQLGTVLDLYCGGGLFTAFLAARAQQVIAVEESPLACEDFVVNLDEFDNVSLFEDAVEYVLPTLKETPDLVLIDPPRKGIKPEAMTELLRLSPTQIVYVSCNPASLVRDAKKLLEGGYALQQLTPYDMFPQTYHIETISVWKKTDV